MKKVMLWSAFLFVSFAFAAPAVYDARPDAVMAALKAEGFQPTFKPGDERAAPSITVKFQGESLYMYFAGCDDGVCRRLNVTTSFERPENAADLARKLAAWNAEWYSQAYEDKDGFVYLDASYLLTGGFTAANFLAWLDAYKRDFDAFYDQLY